LGWSRKERWPTQSADGAREAAKTWSKGYADTSGMRCALTSTTRSPRPGCGACYGLKPMWTAGSRKLAADNNLTNNHDRTGPMWLLRRRAWWVRKNRVGVNATTYDWAVTATGSRLSKGTAAGAYTWVGHHRGRVSPRLQFKSGRTSSPVVLSPSPPTGGGSIVICAYNDTKHPQHPPSPPRSALSRRGWTSTRPSAPTTTPCASPTSSRPPHNHIRDVGQRPGHGGRCPSRTVLHPHRWARRIGQPDIEHRVGRPVHHDDARRRLLDAAGIPRAQELKRRGTARLPATHAAVRWWRPAACVSTRRTSSTSDGAVSQSLTSGVTIGIAAPPWSPLPLRRCSATQ